MREEPIETLSTNPRFDGMKTDGVNLRAGTNKAEDQVMVPNVMILRSSILAPFVTGKAEVPDAQRTYDQGFGLSMVFKTESLVPSDTNQYEVALMFEDPGEQIPILVMDLLGAIISKPAIDVMMQMISAVAQQEHSEGVMNHLKQVMSDHGLITPTTEDLT